jgi:hypothetical protein
MTSLFLGIANSSEGINRPAVQKNARKSSTLAKLGQEKKQGFSFLEIEREGLELRRPRSADI